jgi:hypothetical protein
MLVFFLLVAWSYSYDCFIKLLGWWEGQHPYTTWQATMQFEGDGILE